MRSRFSAALLLKADRPSAWAGMAVAVGGVAAVTAVIYPLEHVAPVLSLGVVYLLAVVVVSMFWGLALGAATAILSAGSFSYFHLPPVGRLSLADRQDWIALAAFVVVAVAVGLATELARSRAIEADQRRQEADVAAELAELLLGAGELEEALPIAAQRLAKTLGVSSAAIELREVPPRERDLAFALESQSGRVGTLLLPAAITGAQRERLTARIAPALASILAAARHRADLQAEVVETAALRRSDEMKTAILRSVSHDLRTPITAILAAAAALDPEDPSSSTAAEARSVIETAATRLSRLIEQLLDLSLLQSGNLEARQQWCSLEEVLQEAMEHSPGSRRLFRLSIGPDLPLLRGDPAQLERAFANILENALRHSADKPVSIRARPVGERLLVRIVDQGPGISPSEQQRIFLPFYRAREASDRHSGSGLGLAIAKGFIEVNGGKIWVESLPGQGTSFVVAFPLERPEPASPRETSLARTGGP